MQVEALKLERWRLETNYFDSQKKSYLIRNLVPVKLIEKEELMIDFDQKNI
jgi:hypothetical protein